MEESKCGKKKNNKINEQTNEGIILNKGSRRQCLNVYKGQIYQSNYINLALLMDKILYNSNYRDLLYV